jgi:putative protease
MYFSLVETGVIHKVVSNVLQIEVECMPEESMKTPVGKVTNYYSKISVAVIELTAPLQKGDEIVIKGATTEFTQTVKSMQIDREDIESAHPGQAIGLKVKKQARIGDTVYRT